MKKAFKITWISLASVVGVVVIVMAIALFLVLSPKRLTSLVNKYASNFITCEYNIGKVDLTLFKTFPNVGLEIDNLVLLNSTKGWTTDTLAAIDECVVSLNIKKLLKENTIIINSCILDGGYINAFFDVEGNNNFDIFPPSEPTEQKPETEDSGSYLIDLNKLKLNNINIIYTDLATHTTASITGLSLKMKGNINEDIILGDLSLSINDIAARVSDDSIPMNAALNSFILDGKIKYDNDDITAKVDMGTGPIAFLMGGDSKVAAGLNGMSLSYNGDVNDYKLVKGVIDLNINDITAVLDDETYLNNAEISLNTPLEFNVESFHAEFDKSYLKLNDIVVDFVGQFAMTEPAINLNMDINTNTLIISELINFVPQNMREEMLEGIDADGKLQLSAHVEGIYDDNTMPIITADVNLSDASVVMNDVLPYPLTNVNTSVHALLDLNEKSDVTLNSLRAKMNNTIVAASGNIKDVLGKMLCNVSLKADADLNDVKSFLPEELIAQGNIKADLNVRGTLDQFTELELMKTKLNGTITCKDLAIRYFDTINVVTSDMSIDFVLPNPSSNVLKGGLAQVKLSGTDINADITGMMTAALADFNIEAQVSDVLDDTAFLAALADFGFSSIDFNMDDMVFHSTNAFGSAFMLPSANEGNTSYAAVYSSDSIVFAMGNEMFFASEALSLDASADYDETTQDLLLQWDPKFNLDLVNAVFAMEGLSEQVVIPEIDMTYSEEGLNVANSRIVLGNSDFNLKGALTNIYNHFKDDELLTGEFNFTSEYTDIDQLMDIFSGMGADETTETQEAAAADTTAKEADPFMVPYGVNIKLHTSIDNAVVSETKLHNIGGDLTVKDGILVLEQMGFTSDAAEMQLTAIYKSKRRNHLYAGFDFHLLNIDIAEMIRIIPDLDTIVPMLKSFAGTAEFHFAAETNMKADYSLKYSTLKAACSIEGQDLVVLDNQTFDKIKRLLFFSKKTDNKIDSLDVQFTVFKNEIDVYPFSIGMDKYHAMLYGRHNLDMSYDYNIAMLSPKIFNRIGVEIKGPDFDNMKFKVRRSRHKNMFKPEKRDYKEEKIAEIKKIISNSLKENVK